ncbi:MAG: 30S ribosomal protein S6 [Verrucomicrobiota bacterium]|nr:30S ribosomal protein S6 [Verrucomicrobiota bacterium]
MDKINHQYRATFILDTRGYDQPVETLVEKLRGVITKLGATVTEAKNHGRKDFSRQVDKRHSGDTYVEYIFSSENTVPAALQHSFTLDKTVKRVLIEMTA